MADEQQHRRFVGRAEELVPRIRARAREVEDLRRPHPDTIADLVDSGLVKLLVPRRWGGAEAAPITLVKVVETLASACMSTGWNSAFIIGQNRMLAQFPEQAQQEVLGERGFALHAMAPGGNFSARREPGGWVISGRASWATGVMDANWVTTSGMTEAGPHFFLMPASDISIGDVWHYSGMAGTGSNDMIVEDVFVPDHRAMSAADWYMGGTPGAKLHDNPMFSVPSMLMMYCETIGVFSGGLKGMVREFAEVIGKRIRKFTNENTGESQLGQIVLGDAVLASRIACELVEKHAEFTAGLIERIVPTVSERIHGKSHIGYVARHCRDAANAMMGNVGSSSFHLDAPIQRFFRDMNMIATHAFWDWDVSRQLAGREALGLEPNYPGL